MMHRRLRSHYEEDLAVCSISRSELYYGAAKSRDPVATLASQREFLAQFLSLPYDDSAAEYYGAVRADLQRKGHMIGPNDLLIACIALANNLILVTHNVREFSRVEGLRFEDWEV